MNKINKKNTFCPLPWNHISVGLNGKGRVCCDGYTFLKDQNGNPALWKESKGLHSYFNSVDYRKIRKQMLKGERPIHCKHCFHQEDHGAKSMRLQYLDQYESDIDKMIKNTNEDGSIDMPEITYVDMALGNLCNLKCRMCHPHASYIIGKDWQKMGKPYDEKSVYETKNDKWYVFPNTLRMLREALPHIRVIFTAGGEPMLVKEHLQILEMIIEEGHAGHITLRYNSNQTVIPERIIKLWRHFEKVEFNCSVEAVGPLNDYIRHPSKWEKLEKNIHFLDQLSHSCRNIEIHIHTTLQAYNVSRIPDLLHWLAGSNFKALYRFPYFIWVKIPEWLSPVVFPYDMRHKIADKILESLEAQKKDFFSYNSAHNDLTSERMALLKSFCGMMKTGASRKRDLIQFIEETKKHDTLRNEFVLNVLPELRIFFDEKRQKQF